ncbi:hypothetical protein Tco_1124234 [Tanacetum coccineum]|uniref:Reverse transcriptase domain-containing protein n=1 Tax=Tanacetum coccineum TaxID=301880 RepID=A0ABQ5J5X1_9ASTR
MKHSYSNDDTCFSIDVIDEILGEDFDALQDEGSKILHSIEGTLLEEEIFFEFDEFMSMTANENSKSESDIEEPPFEKITINTDYKIKTSLEEPPMDLKLKPLPDNLEYVFLEEPYFLHVIISSQIPLPAKVERWAMPTWCHMFNSTLTGSTRKSTTSSKERESTKDSIQRYKAESRHVKGDLECKRISGFIHGITNPELIKRLNDNIPKSVDEMIRTTTAFLWGEVAASNQARKKAPLIWKL